MKNTLYTKPRDCMLHLGLICCALAISAGAGCNEPQGPQLTGFIDNPPPMVRSPKVSTAHVWMHSERRISKYYKYIIDPVKVEALPDDRGKVTEADLEQLAAFFRSEMIRKLRESGKYTIVAQPGAGVLRVRTAITGVRPNTPVLGNCTMEGEIIDTADGVRIAAFTDHQDANRFSLATTSKWGSAEEILTYWAQLLREAADNRWMSGARKF